MIEQLFKNYEEMLARRQYLDWLGFTTKLETRDNGDLMLRAYRPTELQ